MTQPVVVVGGGLSGIACARRLHDAGVPVRVDDRGHRLGGRMAVRTEQLAAGPHAVDIGAPYFTVRDNDFRSVVDGWAAAGLARPWTDRFRGEHAAGPMRWTAANGMRSLVEDLAAGLEVRLDHVVQRIGEDGTVDGEPAAAVVLAMPDPQAERLLSSDLAAQLQLTGRVWTPVLSVWAAWGQRWWPDVRAAFANDSPVLTWLGDDGSSRGDGAPVLVAHTSGDFAQGFLDDAERAIQPALTEMARLLGQVDVPAPLWSRVHRWSLASTTQPHEQPFALLEKPAWIGVCGDAWGERSRVEQAWISGHALAGRLIDALYSEA